MTEKEKGIGKIVKDKGYNIVWEDDHKMMSDCKEFYRGNVNGFHKFNRKTLDGRKNTYDRHKLQMAKRVCEDYASLLWNEKSNIELKEKSLQADWLAYSNENELMTKLNIFIEETYALGNGYIIGYLFDSKPKFNFVAGDNVYIANGVNEEATMIVTIEDFNENDKTYCHITCHYRQDEYYIVEHDVCEIEEKTKGLGSKADIHILFDEQSVNAMTKIENDDGTYRYMFAFETDNVWFTHLKPNIKNNFNTSSPYGLSILANCKDTLKMIDELHEAIHDEIDLSRMKVFLNTEMLSSTVKPKMDGSTEVIEFWDRDKSEYIGVPFEPGATGMNKPLETSQPEIRVEQMKQMQNLLLSDLGIQVGLGANYYKFSEGIQSNTATEEKMNKSEMWRNITKHQFTLERVLKEMVIIYFDMINFVNKDNSKALANAGMNVVINDTSLTKEDIIVNFDDSIIIDDEMIKQDLKDAYASEIISQETYLIKVLGMTEKEAKEEIERTKQEKKEAFDEFQNTFSEQEEDDVDES